MEMFLKHPHPVLAQVAEPVDFMLEPLEDRQYIEGQLRQALESTGYGDKLGVAAPQIGISKRVFIAQDVVMFNPKWIPSEGKKASVEGCYSIVGPVFSVKRAAQGRASWQDINGMWQHRILRGLSAIVFQHEFDHINGKCIADVGFKSRR